MKISMFLPPLLLSVFLVGCPSDSIDDLPPAPDPIDLHFSYVLSNLNVPIEGGTWGTRIHIKCVPQFIGDSVPNSKAILTGPGTLYYFGDKGLVPYSDIADTYRCNGMDLYYRPPANDDVPPEGADVTFACEVINPFTKEWQRSPNYTRHVVRRDSMDFYLNSNSVDTPGWPYGPNNSFSDVALTAGETFARIRLITEPVPPEDIQLKYSLVRPQGYSGALGELVMYWKEVSYAPSTDHWGFNYTAPDVSQPVDIVARFSIYDPWAKETRARELTFHVVPK